MTLVHISEAIREYAEGLAAAQRDLVVAPDVVRSTGATYRQLDHWTRNGYVTPASSTQHGPRKPATPATPGSGNLRFYDAAGVVKVRMMVALTGAGMAPAPAARYADALIADAQADIAPGLRLLVVGSDQ